jgi:hypothetical protein
MRSSYIFSVVPCFFVASILWGGIFAGNSGSKPVSAESIKNIDSFAARLGVVRVDSAAGSSSAGNKTIADLLVVLKKQNPAWLQKLIDLYNTVKKSNKDFTAILPSGVISFFEQRTLNWLHQNGLINANGQLALELFDVLDLTRKIILEGINDLHQDESQGSCEVWCMTCCAEDTTIYLNLTVELLMPVLCKILIMQNDISAKAAVEYVFGEVPPIFCGIFNEETMMALRDMRAELACLVLDKDGVLVDWNTLIKNMEIAIDKALEQ